VTLWFSKAKPDSKTKEAAEQKFGSFFRILDTLQFCVINVELSDFKVIAFMKITMRSF